MTFKKKTGLIPMAASLLFSIFVSSIFFTSCNNFMKGEDFLDELEKTIDYENMPYSNITLYASANYTDTIFPAVGTYNDKYRVTDTFEISFKEKDTWDFLYWSITPENSVSFAKGSSTERNITIKILQIADIKIEPVCKPKDQISVGFEIDHGIITPSETRYYYLNEEFDVECREETGYYFLGWEVTELNHKEKDKDGNPLLDENGEQIITPKKVLSETEYKKIIDIADVSKQKTTVKVLDVNAAIILKPILVIQAVVASRIPETNVYGVYADSKIIIQFDREMNEESVYYTDDEIEDIAIANTTEKIKVLFLLDKEHDNKCYGYQLEGLSKLNTEGEYVSVPPEDTIIYKAFQITALSNKNKNYLQHYGAPYLDVDDTRILTLAPKANNLPPDEVDIYVTLYKKFFYIDDTYGKKIPLTSDYSFSYRINSEKDSRPPEFRKYDITESDFQVRIVPGGLSEGELKYNTEWNPLIHPAQDPNEEDIQTTVLPLINCESKKFWIKGTVFDAESGLYTLEYTVKMIDGVFSKGETFSKKNMYPADSEFKTIKKTLYTYPTSYGIETRIDELIDLSKEDIKEGFYKFTLTLTDYSGKKTNNDFYFLFDNTAPELTAYSYADLNGYTYFFFQGIDEVNENQGCDIIVNILDEIDYSYSLQDVKGFADKTIKVPGIRGGITKYTVMIQDDAGHKKNQTIYEGFAKGGIVYRMDGKNYISINWIDDMTPVGLLVDFLENMYDFNVYYWCLNEIQPGIYSYCTDELSEGLPAGFCDTISLGEQVKYIYYISNLLGYKYIAYRNNISTAYWLDANDENLTGVISFNYEDLQIPPVSVEINGATGYEYSFTNNDSIVKTLEEITITDSKLTFSNSQLDTNVLTNDSYKNNEEVLWWLLKGYDLILPTCNNLITIAQNKDQFLYSIELLHMHNVPAVLQDNSLFTFNYEAPITEHTIVRFINEKFYYVVPKGKVTTVQVLKEGVLEAGLTKPEDAFITVDINENDNRKKYGYHFMSYYQVVKDIQ